MSVLSLPKQSEKAIRQRDIKIHGVADLSFRKKQGETTLGRLYYRDPLKILFPRGDVPTAALVTTGGGLFGGDVYDIDVSLETGAEALVTAQAAEKVYRSSGPDCHVNVQLKVAADAALEWLPQETILFDQARFRRKTTLDFQTGAKALVGEIIVFGRLASGEEVESGLLREAWDVKQDGKLIWTDALQVEGDIQRNLNHFSAFGGARAVATTIYAAPDAEEMLDTARELLGNHKDVRLGATVVNGLLICRWLAKEPYDLRQAFGAFWAAFRHKTLGRQAQLPRLWTC